MKRSVIFCCVSKAGGWTVRGMGREVGTELLFMAEFQKFKFPAETQWQDRPGALLCHLPQGVATCPSLEVLTSVADGVA